MIDRDLIGFVPNRDVFYLDRALKALSLEHLSEYRGAVASMLEQIDAHGGMDCYLFGVSAEVAPLVVKRFEIAGWQMLDYDEGKAGEHEIVLTR